MKPKLLLFSFIILMINLAKSQNISFGASINGGFSKVTSNLPISGEYKVKFTISGNAGLFIEKKISEKSFLGAELLWIQLEGKEVTKNRPLIGNIGQGGGIIGFISDKSKIHLSYIGLPLYYRFNLGKIGIKGGVQSLIFLFASSSYKASGEINNVLFVNENKTKNLTFDTIDFGPKIGIDYSINNYFRARIDYYHGLIDITPDISRYQRKNRQISMGINYIISN